jgi:DNA-binding IclR family transcriptional regulator
VNAEATTTRTAPHNVVDVVAEPGREQSSWTFLSNHAHVLLCIGRDPDVRIRDIADLVGITERAAQGIVGDLVDEGYLVRERVGRRNRYQIQADLALRHPLEANHQIGELVDLLVPEGYPGDRAT